ncbi:MAG: dihydroxyacetone kinase subunit L [Spirochaetaceae bacterium]|nr:MAG: dihydroxyacetone kinase subunit L [Spirochaetaceae bacterium]
MVTTSSVVAWLQKLNDVYTENKSYLTELDSAIGDADHGINMARGFAKVAEAIEQQAPEDIGAACKTVSMTLIKTVGGASGPLYGTFFLKGSMQAAGKTELDAKGLLDLLEAGVDGVVARGKAELEDKTMVDAWLPAIEAMKAAVDQGIGPMLAAGVEAAENGMKATIPLVARKGRASYLGERSKDHQDPGATSTHLMLKAASETLAG